MTNSNVVTLPGTPRSVEAVDLWSSFQKTVGQGKACITRRDGDGDELHVDAAELTQSANGLAAQLVSVGAQPGDCVMLVVGDPLAFACGFWACQAAGFTAVPMPPMGTAVQIDRTLGALACLTRAWIVTDDATSRDRLASANGCLGAYVLGGARFNTIEGLVDPEQSTVSPPRNVDPDAIAVIMFSSGSTGAPKGVELSHKAILAQTAMLKDRLALREDDCLVNWMPMSHDFGLFHFHILPLLCGVKQVLLATEDFSRRPLTWLRILHDHKGTISGAPNLALQMVAGLLKPQRAVQFDLSHLRCISLGAEPLNPQVLSAFAEGLKGAQLSPKALSPAYGLAEATLVLTMRTGLETQVVSRRFLGVGDAVKRCSADHVDGVELPLLGHPLAQVELRIVDDADVVLPAHHVGHLQARCPSLMDGYRNRPDQSAQALRDGGWLATGDLGFLHNGEFVMAGRAKDVIISGGRNYHPGELEQAALGAPGLSKLHQVAIVQGRDPTDATMKTLAFLRGRGPKDQIETLQDAVAAHVVAQTGVALDHVITVRDLPRTSSGKLQRHALSQSFEKGEFNDVLVAQEEATPNWAVSIHRAAKEGHVAALTGLICQEAALLSGARIQADVGVMDQGVSSQKALALCIRLGNALERKVSIALLFDYPSPRALAQALIHEAGAQGTGAEDTIAPQDTAAIAVIGYGCRFPGADSAAQFWEFLNNPHPVTTPIPSDRWHSSQDGAALPPAALLSDIDGFDPALFGVTQAEAEALSPVHRLLLQVLWQALEHAGLDAGSLRGQRVGLFVGLSETGLATGRGEIIEDEDALAAYAVTGSAGSIAVGRMAHLFDFRGPALAVDTACSSSLVALDLAAQALRQGRCDLAIAGGANLILSPDLHAGLNRMGALSPDGVCKTFDAQADGYGRGEGAGLVVLKTRDQAIRDGDSIRAELRATVLNHDGQSASVTAPNGTAQRDLLRRALQEADLAGDDLDWIETHGTGTALGDPIELTSLRDVLRRDSAKPLALGAVKSRIGHLEAAAGMAGLIKALLALEHGFVPADTPCAQLNPHFDWAESAMRPIDRPFDWPASGRQLAGVASFGMSGTNAFAIVSGSTVGADAQAEMAPGRELVLPLSVVNEGACERASQRWGETLADATADNRAALIAGQASRRVTGQWRCSTVLPRSGRADHLLISSPWVEAMTAPRLVFVFPGQGAQTPEMGAQLYHNEPVFRAAFDAASEAAGLVMGRTLTDWLYGPSPATGDQINQTALSQPTLVAYGHALRVFWAALGVYPDAVLGHSVGEIAAALAAGHFDLETAMRLAVRRGHVMQTRAETGAMLALRADEQVAHALIDALPDTVIAGFNGPRAFSLSGPPSQIDEVIARAEREGHVTAPIQVNRAFHGPAMAQAAAGLFEKFQLEIKQGQVPVYSTLYGTLARDDNFASPAYWQQQMLDPVRFAQAVQAATEPGDTICVEMGPGGVVAGMGAASAPSATWVRGIDGPHSLASAIGTIWAHGGPVDWTRYFGSRGAPGDKLPGHPVMNEPMPRRAVWSPGTPKRQATAMPAPEDAPLVRVEAAQEGAVLNTEILPVIARISGVDIDAIAPDAPLTSLGIDSLGMVQLQRALSSKLGLVVELRALFETVETPRKLADLLEQTRPSSAAKPLSTATPAFGGQNGADADNMAELMRAQLKLVEDVIERQLAVMQGGVSLQDQPKAAFEKAPETPERGGEIKGLFRQPNADSSGLSAVQRAHVAELAEEWNAKSAGSKAAAQSARTHVANSRAVFGYTADLKELTYPLMSDRAQGACVWDVDGNRYIDVTMGFGVYLFGHKPDFVMQALHEELDRSAAIGPATPLAEQVAARIHALTGAERSAFFSTGTEAIMCAVRIARAVTSRSKIVIFRGAYHGSFDGILATGWIEDDGTPQSAPLTDGTLQGMVDDVITLEYGDMAALEVIKRQAGDIALVMVEPVQSRHPENRPVEFLQALRALTREKDVPLLFDEVISGFRFAPGGMQEIFGIQADLVTYGKVLGHGQPIGVLAGNARFMDAVDGGAWCYGDDSGPSTRTAFVAGTFNGHPLALAAARSVLDHIQSDDGSMYTSLARRTADMCTRLDAMFKRENIPVRMEWFGSLFRFNFGPGTEILNTHLLNNSVFVWEQRNCFLSTAHGDAEIDQIIQAAQQGVAAMKEAGWFGAAVKESDLLPSGATDLALRRRATDVLPGTWTDLVVLRLGNQKYEPHKVRAAWAQVCARHPALQACLTPTSTRRIGAAATAPMEHCDLVRGSDSIETALDLWANTALDHVFPFAKAPARLTLLEAGEQAIALTSSHLGFDGWSLALILSDLMQALDGITLGGSDRVQSYLEWEETTDYYRSDFAVQPLMLPTDGPEPGAIAPCAQRATRTDIAPLYKQISQKAGAAGITPLAGFMAPYVAMLAWLTGQNDITIGVPVAGQALSGKLDLVGNFSFVRPITVSLTPELTLTELGRVLHAEILKPGSRPPLDTLPERHAMFNLDGPIDLGKATSAVTLHPVPIRGARADLFANLLRVGEQVVLDFDWNSDRFSEQSARAWMDAYLELTHQFALDDMTVAQAFAIVQKELPRAQQGTPSPNPTAKKDIVTAPEPFLTQTQTRLAMVWEELLGVRVPGSNADFQTLGGASLQAVRLQGRIATKFGIEPTLEWVFGLPRLSDMASAIDAFGAPKDTVPMPTSLMSGGIPALPQQQQLLLLEAVSDAGPAYNICLRLDFKHQFDEDMLTVAMSQLAQRHASLRTSFFWTEDQLEQVIAPHPPEDLAPERLVLTESASDALADFAQRPFDAQDPLRWRVGILDQPVGSTIVLVLHHIISDAWSAEIMVRDLLDACQRVALEAAPLPVLAYDFPDHAVWVASCDDTRREALAFWARQAGTMPALTALPGDFPRPDEKSYAGGRASRRVPPGLLRDLRDQAGRLHTTPFQMILASIATFAAAQLGRRELVIGTVSSGRSRPGMDKPIGFFANTLPLCLTLPEDQSWSDRVASISGSLLAATAHDLVSLQEIVAALGLQPDRSANPLFEICVTHDDRRGLSQLAMEMGFEFAEMELPTSQFDLSFYVIETGSELSLDVTYSTDIHRASGVESLLDTLLAALEQLCSNPESLADEMDWERREKPFGDAGISHPPPAQVPDLTALQKRLWFVDRFENAVLYDAAPTYYNMVGQYQLDADLTAQMISDRLCDLYAQVPALNWAFELRGDGPVCVAATALPDPCVNLTPDQFDAFVDAPFDLTAGGLLRVGRLQLADGAAQLVVVAHHIVTDLHGLDQIADVLSGSAINTGWIDSAGLPAVDPAQTTEDLAFWRGMLGANPPRLLLPTDRNRAAVHVYERGTTGAGLTSSELAALADLADQIGVSTDDMVLSAFAALLHRLSGQQTIVLGQTFARQGTGLGTFDNLVTLRIDVDANKPCERMIADIAGLAAQANTHGQTDFDTVVLDLKPENDMSRTALFDVLMVRDNAVPSQRCAPGATGWGKYDLVLAPLFRRDGGLDLGLTFNALMFDQDTVDRWGEMLVHLLRQMPKETERSFDVLTLISDKDVGLLLDAGAARRDISEPAFASVPVALAAITTQLSDAVAVKDHDREMTYGALAEKADIMCQILLAQGVTKGDHIAVLLPRGTDYIIAMTAILLAGAVFVPLDNEAPQDRVALILEDAKVCCAIVTRRTEQILPKDVSRMHVDIAYDRPAIRHKMPELSPEDAAYVIFTSGSTGRPKGVVVEHRNLLALVLGQGDIYPICQRDRWSWFHSAAFDFSIWEVWGALLTGGEVVVIPDAARQDMGILRATLADHNVTQLSLTPSAFRAFSDVEQACSTAELSIKAIWFGGEALTPSTLKPWSQRYPDCHLINLFGITETTVHTTFCALSRTDLDRGDSPIGKPLPSYGLTLRDPALRPVPQGVPGEIVVSGSGVARGYLGHPEQTAARFVDDPYQPGRRLYRSGDLGIRNANGEVSYLGRADDQIKLRGFRIELGEVESGLCGFDGIRSAAAGLQKDTGSDAILAVWITLDQDIDPDALNAHLAKTLPAYMIPRQIFVLDALPLTQNGKIDRAALQGATQTPLEALQDAEAPRPGLERRIADILCEVLDRPHISRRDSFFALGGHSLMANKAVLRLRAQLGMALSLRDFFAAQTVAALARLGSDEAVKPASAIVPVAEADWYPLSSAQTRLFVTQTAQPTSSAYNMVGGFIIEGPVDTEALAGAFADLKNRHEILRTRFAVQAGTPVQRVDPPSDDFAFSEVQIGAGTLAQRISAALDPEFRHVFDLAHDPLMRAGLAGVGVDQWLLVLNLHHIISDGWSVPIMMADLSAFYAMRIGEQKVDLPRPLKIQYRDFASWQNAHALAADRTAAQNHWQDRLGQGHWIANLPTDTPRPAVQSGTGQMARHTLDAKSSAALRHHLQFAGATLFSACAAALHILLRLRGLGEGPTVIGTADAGRDALETEDQLGFYLNLLPHVLNLEATIPLADFLEASASETTAMLGHKTAPFEQMLDLLGVQVNPGHNPVFDILLLVQNNVATTQQLGPHGLRSVPDQTRTARYDLNLMVEDRSEIDLVLEYDSTLFNPDTIQGFLSDFAALLDALVTKPDQTPLTVLGLSQIDDAQGLLDADDPLLGAL
ncbi:MAG: amino acid adenylation domain-containing protein [Sulfitobacter sp.]